MCLCELRSGRTSLDLGRGDWAGYQIITNPDRDSAWDVTSVCLYCICGKNEPCILGRCLIPLAISQGACDHKMAIFIGQWFRGTQLGSDIDYVTGYVHHVLGFIGIKDLTIIDSSGLGRNEEIIKLS